MFQLARVLLLPLLLVGCQQTSVPISEKTEKTGSVSWAQNCKSAPLMIAYSLYELEDFGPASLSTEFTGVHYYDWNSSGSSDPGEAYQIYIVVYADGAERLARQEFIDDKRLYLERDFRFRSLKETFNYIDKKKAELSGFAEDEADPMRPMFITMIDDLDKLKKKLAEDICETY